MNSKNAIRACVIIGLASSLIFGVTSHTVILVMDGARYTETMGDKTHANVPKIAALASKGSVLTNFKTAAAESIAENWSETCPGHARLVTGTYQNIANDGTQLPDKPVIFQQYLKQTSHPASATGVVCSKDKLFILANSSAIGWKDQYQASLSCGVNGDGTGGYREDSLTHDIAKEKLTTDHPALMIINYKGPDSKGHDGDSTGYIAAIREVDGYADELWDIIQSDTELKDKTAMFIVNDHGRHTTDFESHGDSCIGCCHIMCVAIGPDIKQNFSSSKTREQIDIAPTIATMMGFAMPESTGKVITEILLTTRTKRHFRSKRYMTEK